VIPVATTTITITRPGTVDGDPTEATTPTEVAAGVRAVIGSPTGREPEGLERVDAVLTADVCDLANHDLVDDDVTGDHWQVRWARTRLGVGLDHVTAGLVKVGGPDA
jgi:hypothetical protein